MRRKSYYGWAGVWDIRKKDDKLFAQHLLDQITIDDILIHAGIHVI